MPANSPGGDGRSYRLVDNLADELNLCPGQILHAWVADPLPQYSNRIFITLKGNQTVAKTQLDVDRGDELMVRVESTGPPIQLRLYRAEEARDQIQKEQLQHCLETMDYSASQTMIDIARFLLEQHIPLNADTVASARDCWDLLSTGSREKKENRARAFRFLSDRKFRPTNQLIEELETLPEGSIDADCWQSRAPKNSSYQSFKDMDWRSIVQQLGIDLVNQIGKWPHTASRTLHSQLLQERETSDSFPSDSQKQLSQLLGLALSSLSEPETWVMVPFFQGNKARLITMNVSHEGKRVVWHVKAEAEWKEVRIGIEIDLDPKLWDIQIQTSGSSLVNKLQEQKHHLEESLAASEREVNIIVIEESPETLEPFSVTKPPETVVNESGKVDLTI